MPYVRASRCGFFSSSSCVPCTPYLLSHFAFPHSRKFYVVVGFCGIFYCTCLTPPAHTAPHAHAHFAFVRTRAGLPFLQSFDFSLRTASLGFASFLRFSTLRSACTWLRPRSHLRSLSCTSFLSFYITPFTFFVRSFVLLSCGSLLCVCRHLMITSCLSFCTSFTGYFAHLSCHFLPAHTVCLLRLTFCSFLFLFSWFIFLVRFAVLRAACLHRTSFCIFTFYLRISLSRLLYAIATYLLPAPAVLRRFAFFCVCGTTLCAALVLFHALVLAVLLPIWVLRFLRSRARCVLRIFCLLRLAMGSFCVVRFLLVATRFHRPFAAHSFSFYLSFAVLSAHAHARNTYSAFFCVRCTLQQNIVLFTFSFSGFAFCTPLHFSRLSLFLVPRHHRLHGSFFCLRSSSSSGVLCVFALFLFAVSWFIFRRFRRARFAFSFVLFWFAFAYLSFLISFLAPPPSPPRICRTCVLRVFCAPRRCGFVAAAALPRAPSHCRVCAHLRVLVFLVIVRCTPPPRLPARTSHHTTHHLLRIPTSLLLPLLSSFHTFTFVYI